MFGIESVLWFDICSRQTKRFMKSYIFLFISIFSLSSFKADVHKTYLSVTEVEYSEAEHSLQIVSRVFINDFEDVLSQRYQKEVSLSYKDDLKAHKDLMHEYLQKKLHIAVDGEEKKLNLLGSKFDADQIVLFIEVPDVPDFKKISIQNLVLTDLFDTQKNIVNVKKGEKTKSMMLMKDESTGVLNF